MPRLPNALRVKAPSGENGILKAESKQKDLADRVQQVRIKPVDQTAMMASNADKPKEPQGKGGEKESAIKNNSTKAKKKSVPPPGSQAIMKSFFRKPAGVKTTTKAVEAKAVEAKAVEAKAVEAKAVEAKAVEAKAVEAKAVEAKAIEAKAVEAKAVEAKAIEAKAVEAKAKGRKRITKMPSLALEALAVSIAQGCIAASKKGNIIEHFLATDSSFKMPKKLVAEQFGKWASHEKVAGDTEKRWWPSNEAVALLDSKLSDALSAIRTKAKAVCDAKEASALDSKAAAAAPCASLTEVDDPRIGTYRAYLDQITVKLLECFDVDIFAGDASKTPISENKVATCDIKAGTMPATVLEQDSAPASTTTQSGLIALDSEEASVLIASAVQGRRGTLVQVYDSIEREICSKIAISSRSEGEAKLLLLAERKAYGYKGRGAIPNTDTNPDAHWRWETVNLAQLPDKIAKAIAANRREVSALSKRFAAAYKLVHTLSANHEGKQETKAQKEIELVLKYMRDDTVTRQKAEKKMREQAEKERAAEERTRKRAAEKLVKAEEAAEKKRKLAKPAAPPSKKMTMFFTKKVTPVKAKPPSLSESLAASRESGASESEALIIDKDYTAATTACEPPLSEPLSKIVHEMDAIFDLPSHERKPLILKDWVGTIRREKQDESSKRKYQEPSIKSHELTRLKEAAAASQLASGFVDLTATAAALPDAGPAHSANLAKKKLFQFHASYRPPYFGTFRKTSKEVRPRKFWGKDPALDYEFDSDEEWEEPEDAESLADSEVGSNLDGQAGDTGLDYQDGWLVGDDDVVGGSDDEADEGTANTQSRRRALDRYQVGILYDRAQIEEGVCGEHAKNLLLYKVEPMPNASNLTEALLPVEPPSVNDILQELMPKKAKKRKALIQADEVEERSGDPSKKRARTAPDGGEPASTSEIAGSALSVGGTAPVSRLKADQLAKLADFIRGQGNMAKGINVMVDAFQIEQKKQFALEYSSNGGGNAALRKEDSKRNIKAAISAIAIREKRGNEPRARWFIRPAKLQTCIDQANNLAPASTSLSPHSANASQVSPKGSQSPQPTDDEHKNRDNKKGDEAHVTLPPKSTEGPQEGLSLTNYSTDVAAGRDVSDPLQFQCPETLPVAKSVQMAAKVTKPQVSKAEKHQGGSSNAKLSFFKPKSI